MVPKAETRKIAGGIGVIGGVYAILATFLATFLAGAEFSWSRNSLSDLGLSSVANIFNFSLILTGICCVILTFGLTLVYAKNTSFKAGSAVLALGAVCLSLVGILTPDYGAPHYIAAFGYFILFPVGVITVGFAFSKLNMQNRGKLSIFAGALALAIILVGIALYRVEQSMGVGFAVPEYAEALVLSIWAIGTGAKLTR